jgi:DNA-binding HxlR family transcriptional regulator
LATVSEEVHPSTSSECPVERTLAVVKDHWSLEILRDLLEKEPRRFNELKRSLAPISAKVLAERLRDLQRAGLVMKKVYAQVPVRVDYSLTEKGLDFNNVIEAFRAWGERWVPQAVENPATR